jgi:glycosyltransferase involved in cell wall biosynthesis
MTNPGHAARVPRVLFCSYHCAADPSSGATLATRDLLALLGRRGWSCGTLCGPLLDFEQPPPLDDLIRAHAPAVQVRQGHAAGAAFALLHFTDDGRPVTVFRPDDGTSSPPTPGHGQAFLSVFEGVLDRFRPELVLTYGGTPLGPHIIAAAKRRGLPVVFLLHNFAYRDARLFRQVDAVLVPSAFARDHYRRTLGLDCTALPYCLDWGRVVCPEVRGRFATFVNPQPHKGLFWFARLAHELGRRRPDVPLLVVEGRGRAEALAACGLDLSGLRNLHRLANTPDPREFYAVSRAVLVPSLWDESFGRVAAEALANGLPVLASRRGALPETLQGAGFLFDIPARYTPQARLVPSAEEVGPWVDTLERLWDDADYYQAQRRRCLGAAETWRPERLAPLHEAFFLGVLRRGTSGSPEALGE